MSKFQSEKKGSECEFCHQTFKSLSVHQRTNRKCVELQEKQYGEKEPRGSCHNNNLVTQTQEEAESSQPNQIPNAPVSGPVLDALYTVAKLIKDRHMAPGPESLLPFLREEIRSFQNSCFSPEALGQLKDELTTWLDAEEYNINQVWNGIEQGLFNPARGRGGNTDKQREIQAKYILMKWKKMQVMNDKHKQFWSAKKRKFREWEAIENTGRFERKQGSVLFAIYGGEEPTFLQQGGTRGEKVIQTVSHWCDVISWFKWRFFCIKKVIMLRLKHPIPLSVMDDIRERYEEVVRYLEASPFSQSQTQTRFTGGQTGGRLSNYPYQRP